MILINDIDGLKISNSQVKRLERELKNLKEEVRNHKYPMKSVAKVWYTELRCAYNIYPKNIKILEILTSV